MAQAATFKAPESGAFARIGPWLIALAVLLGLAYFIYREMTAIRGQPVAAPSLTV